MRIVLIYLFVATLSIFAAPDGIRITSDANEQRAVVYFNVEEDIDYDFGSITIVILSSDENNKFYLLDKVTSKFEGDKEFRIMVIDYNEKLKSGAILKIKITKENLEIYTKDHTIP